MDDIRVQQLFSNEYQARLFQILIDLYDININRRRGRSYTQAVVFIELALRYPHMPIYYFDHATILLNNLTSLKQHIVGMIQNVLNSKYDLETAGRFSFHDTYMRYD